MEEIIPISDLQSQAKKYVEAAKTGGERIIVTQRGRAAAVIVGYDEYRRLTTAASAEPPATPPGLPDQKKIARFCNKWQIDELAVFGSVLREDFGPESDVDVLISFKPEVPWSAYDWVDMTDDLQELFGHSVHLVDKSGLRNPFRRQEILQTMKVLYAA